MKKLLLFTAVSLISFGSFAQLNVVKTEPKEEVGKVKTLFDTEMESYKRGNDYTIMYRDIEYQQITEFKSFSLNEEAFYQLYDLILENWDNPPKEDIMIDLEEGYVWLKFARMMGITNVQFVHSPLENAEVFGRSAYLTKKKLDKLFGKR